MYNLHAMLIPHVYGEHMVCLVDISTILAKNRENASLSTQIFHYFTLVYRYLNLP